MYVYLYAFVVLTNIGELTTNFLQGMNRFRTIAGLAFFMKSGVDRSLNHAFLLSTGLILVFFLAMLAYRYASAKLVESSRTNHPTR